MMVLHGCPVIISQSQGVTAGDEEVIVEPYMLKVMHTGCQVAGQQGQGICIAGYQATSMKQDMHGLQHIGCMCAIVIRVVTITFLNAPEKST
jgi:hypothetical protein